MSVQNQYPTRSKQSFDCNIVYKIVFLLALFSLVSVPKAADAHHSTHQRSAIATYYSHGDSNPHLANGDYYGSSGPWFCAVDSSRRRLLNHRIRVVNKSNGLSHIFLVADLGRFSRGNIDISRGGSSRMTGRGGPDSFPVEWHDLGLDPRHKRMQHRHRRN
ncbi:MAG: hypothetical protein ACRYFS_15205 [Janthinobacterium lividum]